MANLLANPSLWEDNYEYRPPSEWNGTSYAQSTDPSTMSAFTTLYLDEIPADGGSLAGEASVSWADDGFSIWLNFQQWSDDADNFVVFDQVELVNGGTVQFDVAIPAGSTDRILISMGHENGQSNMYYGLSYEVTPASDLVANDDEATTNAGTPVTVDVLANDTLGDEPVALEQLEGPPTIHEQPANGTVSVGADGRITYTPSPGFTGTDEFVYRIATPEPEPPEDPCPEIWFENSWVPASEVEAAVGESVGGNIYFTIGGVTFNFNRNVDDDFTPAPGDYLPCSPLEWDLPEFPWEVDLYWGDGSGGVCVSIYNGCS